MPFGLPMIIDALANCSSSKFIFQFFGMRFRTCPAMFFLLNLLKLFMTFVVLHKSRFSRLTFDLTHSLFQLNELQILSLIFT